MNKEVCMKHACVKSASSEHVKRATPPSFLLKTHTLVEDPPTNDIISWNDQGTTFIVWRPVELARDLLPTLFKHSNFSSFVRQLNTYGFRKVASGRWEFHHNMFRRGERQLLCEIQRRKAWDSKLPQSLVKTTMKESNDHQRFSSSMSSSPSSYVSLSYENKRLKRENGDLCVELASTKKKCNELLNLVAFHLNSKKMVVEQRPKLFGVWLDLPQEKRREHEEFSENMSALSSQC
ncbi:heat stress transcription factor B-3-like protein [Cinnamomum micranthum f. kanehirae]|uniref:Heat stress transcription factor B-3-like protein n=1 Tax=Cinnamomum micranthum f. kanehirae TaxID=337451 RepID=A0A443PVG7_9MAGN|nr:heat stress transcription factor B-3-like protein [Cinnamomum micranthum f. kanehirae]